MAYTPRYFSEGEFKRCSPSCSIANMDEHFLRTLDALREKCGIPLVLNCAYRSREWDLSRGRSGNSAHTKGKGVDIRCNASQTRYTIVKNALEMGFTRIGIGETFVHLDMDESLPQQVIFTYY